MKKKTTSDQLRSSYINFFYLEYSIRNAWKNVDRNALYKRINDILDFINFNIKDCDDKYITDLLLNKHASSKYNILTIAGNYGEEIDTLYGLLMSDEALAKSLDYIFDVSNKYGVYATDISCLSDKLFNIKDFSDDSIAHYIRASFCQQRIRPESVKNSIYSLSPDQLQDLFECNYENGDHLLRRYALLIDIERKDFCLEDVIEEAKRDIVMFTIRSKVSSGWEITKNEWKLYSKYNPAFTGKNFRVDAVKKRLVGLVMWDLVTMRGYEPKKAFDELYKSDRLSGFRSDCKKEDGIIRDDNGKCSCRLCAHADDCFSEAHKYFMNADSCIRERRILPTS